MNRWITLACSAVFISMSLVGIGQAQENFTLTSPAFENGGTLPADLRCTRDGGDGASPPIIWTSIPEGTKSLALIMHHYPRGKSEGTDAPSQYWLLWNIPVKTTGIERGNPLSIGTEGSDKDGRHTGYTPPCSPSGQQHEYTITVYALNAELDSLPTNDDLSVDWSTMTNAMQGKVISLSKITFLN
tara:strand:- start:300 stop:857 length:558 start_codon:yes stop_codon:yes gene_type:complete